MRIFISWSGKRSKATALLLKEWLPQVIQAVEPWLSPDIEKGKRWNKEISENLEHSNVGIICLNRENLHEDWILFEAGALSKTKEAYVCTFLLDIKPSDVEEPLAQFQHTLFAKDDVFKLIQTVNNKLKLCGEKQLNERTLENVFNTFWPEFESKLSELLRQDSMPYTPARDIDSMVKEILEIVRSINRNEDFVIDDPDTSSFMVFSESEELNKRNASRFEITFLANVAQFRRVFRALNDNGLNVHSWKCARQDGNIVVGEVIFSRKIGYNRLQNLLNIITQSMNIELVWVKQLKVI